MPHDEKLVLLRRAVLACAEEGVRRERGEAPDSRFDVPLAMLLDLADELELLEQVERSASDVSFPVDIDALIEDLHGRL